MIDLIELILEKVTNKVKYGSGQEHDVYMSASDPDKLFKVKKPSLRIKNWPEVFKQHPNLFPKVYRDTDKWTEVEKLDTEKASRAYQQLGITLFDLVNDYTKKRYKVKRRLHATEDILREVFSNETFKNYIETELSKDQKKATLFKKWYKLVSEILKIQPEADIHSDNFGYDKSGKLKMIDL